MLAVALGTTVYLWNADSGQIIELTSTVDAVLIRQVPYHADHCAVPMTISGMCCRTTTSRLSVGWRTDTTSPSARTTRKSRSGTRKSSNWCTPRLPRLSCGRAARVPAGAHEVQWLSRSHAYRQVRTMRGHTGRVSSLASPKPRPWMVSSGGRDSSIINHDLRAPNHVASTLLAHTQEVRPAESTR